MTPLRCCTDAPAATALLFYRSDDRWSSRLYGVALRITRESPRWPVMHSTMPSCRFGRWGIATILTEAGAEAWMVGMVRFRALDIVVRRAREVPGYEPEEREDESPDALARLVSTTEGAALHRCLNELEEERRRLVVLACVDGLSHSELAGRMSVPLGTVKSWIRRSLIQLRGCLAS